jgi:hypothetical protein
MTFDGRLILGLATGLLGGIVFAIWAVTQLYAHIDNPKVKKHLEWLLYCVDEECDDLEIPAKRALAIMAVQQLLGWKRLFLPTVVVGFVIDLIVKIVRKIGVPDLHQEAPAEKEMQP